VAQAFQPVRTGRRSVPLEGNGGDFLPRQRPGLSWFFLLLVLALLASMLSGCQPPEAEKTYGGPDTGPAYGDLFIDASIGDASTLLPPLASDASSHAIIGLV